MARTRNGRRRRPQQSGVGNGSSRTIQVRCERAVGKASRTTPVDVEHFPGLKSALSGVVQWKISQAIAEYSSLNPAATGLVAFSVTSLGFGDHGYDSILANGGKKSMAAAAIARSSSFGGLSDGSWMDATSSAALLQIGTVGVSDDVGSITLTLTMQTRGTQ